MVRRILAIPFVILFYICLMLFVFSMFICGLLLLPSLILLLLSTMFVGWINDKDYLKEFLLGDETHDED